MATTSRKGIPKDDGCIPDPELVRRVREDHSDEALALLAGRHVARLQRLSAKWAWGAHLRGADIDDAQDAGHFALSPAVASYEADRNCSFQTHLDWKTWGRFRDFERARRRAGRRYEQSERAARAVESGAGACLVLGSRGGDPAAEAEQHELLEKVRQVVGEVGEAAVRLWEGLAAGRSLHEMAPALGPSYPRPSGCTTS